MDDKYLYYAIFLDGSFTPIKTLSEIGKLPHYDSLLKVKTYGEHSTRYSEFTFIDERGDDMALRVGDWEVTYIQREDVMLKLQPGQQYKLSYKLYSHITKTVFDFPRYVRGIEFLKEELFPNLAILSESPEHINISILNSLNNIRSEILDLRELILKVDKINANQKSSIQ